jgi:hypothetical protein
MCCAQVDLKDPGLEGFEDEFSEGYPSSVFMDDFTRLFQYAARGDDDRVKCLRFVTRENEVWEGRHGSNPIGDVHGLVVYLPASAEVGGESRRFLHGLGTSNPFSAGGFGTVHELKHAVFSVSAGRLMPLEGVGDVAMTCLHPSPADKDAVARAKSRCVGMLLFERPETLTKKEAFLCDMEKDLRNGDRFTTWWIDEMGREHKMTGRQLPAKFESVLRDWAKHDKAVQLTGRRELPGGVISFEEARGTDGKKGLKLGDKVSVRLSKGKDGYGPGKADASAGQANTVYGEVTCLLPPAGVEPGVDTTAQTCVVRLVRLPAEFYGQAWDFDFFRVQRLLSDTEIAAIPDKASAGPTSLALKWEGPEPAGAWAPAARPSRRRGAGGGAGEADPLDPQWRVELKSGDALPAVHARVRGRHSAKSVVAWTTDHQGLNYDDGRTTHPVVRADRLGVRLEVVKRDTPGAGLPVTAEGAVQGEDAGEGGYFRFPEAVFTQAGVYELTFRVTGQGLLRQRPFLSAIPPAVMVLTVLPGPLRKLVVRRPPVTAGARPPHPLDRPLELYVSLTDGCNPLPNGPAVFTPAGLQQALRVTCPGGDAQVTVRLGGRAVAVGGDGGPNKNEVAVLVDFALLGDALRAALLATPGASHSFTLHWNAVLPPEQARAYGQAGPPALTADVEVSVCAGAVAGLELDTMSDARHFFTYAPDAMVMMEPVPAGEEHAALAVENGSKLAAVTLAFRDKWGLPATLPPNTPFPRLLADVGSDRAPDAEMGPHSATIRNYTVRGPTDGDRRVMKECLLVPCAFRLGEAASANSRGLAREVAVLQCRLAIEPSGKPHAITWLPGRAVPQPDPGGDAGRGARGHSGRRELRGIHRVGGAPGLPPRHGHLRHGDRRGEGDFLLTPHAAAVVQGRGAGFVPPGGGRVR